MRLFDWLVIPVVEVTGRHNVAPTDSAAPAPQGSFADFMREVSTMLGEKAAEKGYNESGPDGDNHLFYVTGIDHACGEMIYKAIRYRSTRDPKDMAKAAAWAFLAWKHRNVQT